MSSPGLPARYARTSWGSEEMQRSAAEMLPTTSAPRPAGEDPKPSNPRRRIATQNEGSRSVKEDPSNLGTFDVLSNHCNELWGQFGTWNNRQILKNISASPQVLRTYHDSFLFGEVPLSVRARTLFRAGFIGSAWQLMEFVLALLSGVLYVYSTYKPGLSNNWPLRVQNVISIAFVADYILRVYCEPVRLYFIFSFWGIIDILSCIPVILLFRNNIEDASLLRLFQFVRIVRVFSLTHKVGLFGSSVMQQILVLTVATFGVIFLDAGILHWVEYHLASPSTKASCSDQGCLTFWEALYFLIVTIATVGYGDITPKTIVGQLIAIITIIAALTILPVQIGRITALAYRRPYGGSFSARKIVGARFLIISGSITFAAVQTFLAEFYNPTHCEDLEVYPLHVIILAPFSPSFELKQVLSLYNGLVEFIEGSPVRQSDLERVSADKATAFFLLADKEAENVEVEDAAQVVRALAVHRFCNANHRKQKVRIIVEILDPETHGSAVWDESYVTGVEVICPVKVHYKMMARSCAVRGLYTLIANLFTSELQLKYVDSKHFLTEYFHSFDNEVYPVVLPQAFHDVSFEEVAEFIFVNFGSTLFAVDTLVGYKSDGQADRKVLLYPKGHRINFDDVGIIIANSLHTAYRISMYQPKDEVDNLVHRLWVRFTTTPTIKRDNQGIQLLDPTSGKWKWSSSTKFSASRQNTGEGIKIPFGEHVSESFPSSSDGSLKLEQRVKSALENVYSSQERPNWTTEQPVASEIGILQGRGIDNPLPESKTKVATDESKTKARHHLPKAMALQRTAEELLAWPPQTYGDKPHPAVIEERQDLILKHLKERTITMVAFNKPHILVCCQTGWPTHFFYFLVEIHRPRSPNPPIVILHPRDLTAKQWGSIGGFDDVFFMKGSPIYELDLLRGGVLQAERIVILSDQGTPVDMNGREADKKKYLKRTPAAYTSDVENIIVAANVQRLYGHKPSENIIVEMQHPEGFYYLRPQYEISSAHFPRTAFRRNRDALVHFGPPFMEGKAVSSALLGFLIRSSFYNRNTQSIVDQFIEGGYIKTEDGFGSGSQIVLDQVAVPEQYANRLYSELFLGFLREKADLVIGLYRARGTLGAPTAYVYTNPRPDCIVNPDDLVYVLH